MSGGKPADFSWVGKKLGWCGCGDQARIDRLVMEYLASLDVPDTETPNWPDPDTASDARFLLAYIVDGLDWTEHGGTIFYPWLTPRGRAAFTALTKNHVS